MVWNAATDWTLEQIDDLTRLWAQGRTVRQIAETMHLTPSQVVGKAHRLKLPGRPSPIKRGGARVAAKAKPRKEPRPRQAGLNGAHVPQASKPKTAAHPYTPPDPAQATDTSVLHSRCAFPTWGYGERPNHRYCGQPISEGSYCTHHASICLTTTGKAGEAA